MEVWYTFEWVSGPHGVTSCFDSVLTRLTQLSAWLDGSFIHIWFALMWHESDFRRDLAVATAWFSRYFEMPKTSQTAIVWHYCLGSCIRVLITCWTCGRVEGRIGGGTHKAQPNWNHEYCCYHIYSISWLIGNDHKKGQKQAKIIKTRLPHI